MEGPFFFSSAASFFSLDLETGVVKCGNVARNDGGAFTLTQYLFGGAMMK